MDTKTKSLVYYNTYLRKNMHDILNIYLQKSNYLISTTFLSKQRNPLNLQKGSGRAPDDTIGSMIQSKPGQTHSVFITEKIYGMSRTCHLCN